jgi:hypothetical protein
MAAAVKWIGVSDVNKDLNVKAKAKTKAKDLTIKANDLTFKVKALTFKANDLENVLKDRPRPRTNITGWGAVNSYQGLRLRPCHLSCRHILDQICTSLITWNAVKNAFA